MTPNFACATAVYDQSFLLVVGICVRFSIHRISSPIASTCLKKWDIKWSSTSLLCKACTCTQQGVDLCKKLDTFVRHDYAMRTRGRVMNAGCEVLFSIRISPPCTAPVEIVAS